jgi:hypothetical protein
MGRSNRCGCYWWLVDRPALNRSNLSTRINCLGLPQTVHYRVEMCVPATFGL